MIAAATRCRTWPCPPAGLVSIPGVPRGGMGVSKQFVAGCRGPPIAVASGGDDVRIAHGWTTPSRAERDDPTAAKRMRVASARNFTRI